MSPLTFAMATAKRKFHSDIQLPHSWATFSGDFHALSYNKQDHTFMGDYIIPVLNQQNTNFAMSMATHIPLRHSALPWQHRRTFALWHLAAIILSQLNNYFFPSFLPSFLRDLQRKRTLYSGYH